MGFAQEVSVHGSVLDAQASEKVEQAERLRGRAELALLYPKCLGKYQNVRPGTVKGCAECRADHFADQSEAQDLLLAIRANAELRLTDLGPICPISGFYDWQHSDIGRLGEQQ